jgi:hypothetical protein
MEIKKAIKLAIAALKKERHAIAFDANTVKAYGHGSPAMEKNARRFDEINEAIQVLEAIK